MNKIKAGIFALGSVAPGNHAAYNEWHSFDHIPENVSAPGVPYGARYVSTPDLMAMGTVGDPGMSGVQYLVTYYIDGEPPERIVQEHHELNLRLTKQGRDFKGDRTIHFISPFYYAGGYVNPRLEISPEALLYRPHTGVNVVMADMSSPDDFNAVQQWCHEVHFPDMCSPKGYAGVWRFVSRGGSYAGFENPRERFLHVYFLDGDPIEALTDSRRLGPSFVEAGRHLPERPRKVVFVRAFRTIDHQGYRWFD